MMGREIEVKFHLSDESTIRDRLLALGAGSNGRAFETNIRFEDDGRSLIRRRSLLRLRKDRKTTLTFKSSPPEKNPDFKVFHELEVEVNDFDTMVEILGKLGYHREQVYEKWRETFRLEHTLFCIDTMPYGSFLEIEGEKGKIRRFADLLQLDWRCRILENYLRIFELLKDRLGLPFSDLTFRNFSGLKLDLSSHLDMLVAEKPYDGGCA